MRTIILAVLFCMMFMLDGDFSPFGILVSFGLAVMMDKAMKGNK